MKARAQQKNQLPAVLIFAGILVCLILASHYFLFLPQQDFEKAFIEDNSTLIWWAISARPVLMEWRSEQGETWLHKAAQVESPRVAKVLLEKGAAVDALDGLGRSPLENAISCQSPNVTRVLLAHGADATQYPRDTVHGFHKPEPLYHAAIKGNVEIAVLLVAHGAKIMPVGRTSNSTPLHLACENTQYAMVAYLVTNGAEVNAQDRLGMTPLMWAVRNGRVASLPIVNLLLAHGAEVNARNNAGITALMLASMHGHPPPVEVVKVLLDAGADRAMKSPAGNTALSLARQYGQQEIVDYFNNR